MTSPNEEKQSDDNYLSITTHLNEDFTFEDISDQLKEKIIEASEDPQNYSTNQSNLHQSSSRWGE